MLTQLHNHEFADSATKGYRSAIYQRSKPKSQLLLPLALCEKHTDGML